MTATPAPTHTPVPTTLVAPSAPKPADTDDDDFEPAYQAIAPAKPAGPPPFVPDVYDYTTSHVFRGKLIQAERKSFKVEMVQFGGRPITALPLEYVQCGS